MSAGGCGPPEWVLERGLQLQGCVHSAYGKGTVSTNVDEYDYCNVQRTKLDKAPGQRLHGTPMAESPSEPSRSDGDRVTCCDSEWSSPRLTPFRRDQAPPHLPGAAAHLHFGFLYLLRHFPLPLLSVLNVLPIHVPEGGRGSAVVGGDRGGALVTCWVAFAFAEYPLTW